MTVARVSGARVVRTPRSLASARHARWLDAAGIADPELRGSFEACRALHAAHGRTYYLATLLLPPAKRPYVHGLYGFARYTDEIADNADPATRHERLMSWTERVLADMDAGHSTNPVCQALLHTLRTWRIPETHVIAFLRSMLMDLSTTGYETYEELREYMHGSAAVIGLQMVPILEPMHEDAYPRARALGEAFQLTNFLRDIVEDLRRGRVYLPQEDLDTFGVRRHDLAQGIVTSRMHALLAHEADRAHRLYRYAEPGIALLAPSSRECVRTAFTLYRDILTEIERADYQVFDRRITVARRRRIGIAGAAYLRAALRSG